MCKKLLCFILTFLTLMIIPGCSSGMNFTDGDMDIYKKIHKKYAYMESYTARAEMTVYSNKTQNKYELLQYTKNPKMFRTEFLTENGDIDTVIIEKEGCVAISSPLGGTATTNSSDVPDCTFANNFFALFYKSHETAVNVSGQDNNSSIMLETDIFPVSKDAKKAVMTLDEKANIKSIKIYDAGANLRTEIVFKEFNYNEKINDELFDLE